MDKKKQKKLIEQIMRGDEELGLYGESESFCKCGEPKICQDSMKLSMCDNNMKTTTSNSTDPLSGLDNIKGWVSVEN